MAESRNRDRITAFMVVVIVSSEFALGIKISIGAGPPTGSKNF
jgi:hypothetical protein